MGLTLCRGYAKQIALPLLRSFYTEKQDDYTRVMKDEAIKVIRKCMEVLYYRVSPPQNSRFRQAQLERLTVADEGIGRQVVEQVYDWDCVQEGWD